MATIIHSDPPTETTIGGADPGTLVRDAIGEIYVVDDEGGATNIESGYRTREGEAKVTPLSPSEVLSLQNDA